MRVSSYSLPQRATHFSDCTVVVSHSCPTPWGRCTAFTLRKTRNQLIDNTETFRQLLGENLAQLSFEERQAIAQCLISQVIVTGEAVDIQFVLPFESTPQVAPRLTKEPEGIPGHFYRLRLAHFHLPSPF